MHFLLGISSIALFTFGSSLALRLLHGVGSWRHRRYVQCLVLSIPLASLGLGLVGLHHFTGRACLRDAPYWDSLVRLALGDAHDHAPHRAHGTGRSPQKHFGWL